VAMMVEASMGTPRAILHKRGHYVQVISDRHLRIPRLQSWECQLSDTLSQLGPAARGAVPFLVECLRGKKAVTAFDAATALGKIGPAAGAAVPDLILLTEPKEPNVRLDAEALSRVALESLRPIGRADSGSIPEFNQDHRPSRWHEEGPLKGPLG
jgi:hypothetical protein